MSPAPQHVWFHRVGWTIAVLAIAAVCLAAGGAAYQAFATASERTHNPAPGQMVDVGGHRLHLLCQGSGAPTVILDAGLGDSWLTWQRIQPEVARSSRACSYDRAGLGYSDAGPLPRDSRRIVAELHELLANAHVAPPYVLVGHSFGGYNTRLFAYTYPAEVSALVLVDVAHEDLWARYPEGFRAMMTDIGRELCGQARLAPLGYERLWRVTAADTNAAPPASRAFLARLGYGTSWYRAQCSEFQGFATTSADELRSARHPLTIPVYVLDGNTRMADALRVAGLSATTADSTAATWHQLHREYAASEGSATLIVAERTSHYVQLDRPELVVQAIAEAVAGRRKD